MGCAGLVASTSPNWPSLLPGTATIGTAAALPPPWHFPWALVNFQGGHVGAALVCVFVDIFIERSEVLQHPKKCVFYSCDRKKTEAARCGPQKLYFVPWVRT